MNAPVVKPIIVSIAWGEEFFPLADRLEESAKRFGLETKIERRPSKPARPVDAWKTKPAIMLGVMEATRGPVLWLDADCVIHRDPSKIFALEGVDIAAYQSSAGRWEDGVLLAFPRRRGHNMLQDWRDRCAAPEVKWTHEELSRCIKKYEVRVFNLPPEYCWNHRWMMRDRWGNRSPVIEPNAK